jgi:superfamily II DNA/RNA helicase
MQGVTSESGSAKSSLDDIFEPPQSSPVSTSVSRTSDSRASSTRTNLNAQPEAVTVVVPTIVFANRAKTAQYVAQQLRDRHGCECVEFHKLLPDLVKQQNLELFRKGKNKFGVARLC